MSRIFEALQKERGEVSDLLFPHLNEPPHATPGNEAAVSQEEAVRLVLGDAADDAPPRPPEAQAETAAPLPVAPPDEFRQLRIDLRGPGPLLPFDGTDSPAAEQYRIIRTKLLQHPKSPRMVLVSSAGPGDGKSVTAVNLAGALSLKTGARVLLVDADFRRSILHTLLGLPPSPGLGEVLCGRASLREAVIHTEQFSNLFVITAGEPLQNPSERLDSPRWTELCEDMRAEFGYIVMDSPPVSSVADYDLLQASCDGVVMVARPDHTARGDLLRALQIVPKDKMIGVVMNCVTSWFLARSHQYRQYYSYQRADR